MLRPAFLMCRPTFYGVDYEINPWMDVRRQPDRGLAVRQWQALRRLLEGELGATVLTCRARRGLPDMCFTANAGLVCGKVFIPSRFRHQERAGEAPLFTGWFRRQGYRVVELRGDHRFEGAGDALFMGRTLFAGYYYRTDIETHQAISRLLKVRAVSLELVNDRFYHLDTCFCPIGPSTAIHYPGAFDRYGLKVLEENVDDLIAVTHDEAYQFACNSVAVGKRVIIPEPCDNLCRELSDRGYTAYQQDLSQFAKAGGAARCLTLRIG